MIIDLLQVHSNEGLGTEINVIPSPQNTEEQSTAGVIKVKLPLHFDRSYDFHVVSQRNSALNAADLGAGGSDSYFFVNRWDPSYTVTDARDALVKTIEKGRKNPNFNLLDFVAGSTNHTIYEIFP